MLFKIEENEKEKHYYNKGVTNESYVPWRRLRHLRITFPSTGLYGAKIGRLQPSICPGPFSVCHLADAAVGPPIHPAALHFNQHHIKFNTCFEIRTRSKVLPEGGG